MNVALSHRVRDHWHASHSGLSSAQNFTSDSSVVSLARLLTDATTIAELHAIIQIAFGWSDSHLHQFVIHGKPYGIAYLGGVSFADNPD